MEKMHMEVESCLKLPGVLKLLQEWGEAAISALFDDEQSFVQKENITFLEKISNIISNLKKRKKKKNTDAQPCLCKTGI